MKLRATNSNESKHFWFTAAALVVAAVCATGCMTNKERVELIKQQRQSTDRIANAALIAADAVIRNDNSTLVAAFDAGNEATRSADVVVSSIQSRLASQEGKMNDMLATMASFSGLANSVAPGAGTVVNSALTSLRSSITSVQFTNSQEIAQIRLEKITRAEVEQRLEKNQESVDKQIAALVSQRDVLADTISKQKQEVLAEISKNVKDQEEFKQDIVKNLRELGADEETVKKAQSLSTEELIALLGTSGVGLTALLRTFGKSRSQTEINELYDKIEGLQKVVAKQESVQDQIRDLEMKKFLVSKKDP